MIHELSDGEIEPRRQQVPKYVRVAMYEGKYGFLLQPVCIITVYHSRMGGYVEWVHVDEGERRKGIATEVLRALEKRCETLQMEGVTEAGEAFCEAYFKDEAAA